MGYMSASRITSLTSKSLPPLKASLRQEGIKMKTMVLCLFLAIDVIPDTVRAGEIFNYGKYWIQLPPMIMSASC
jgi:hypothetical protein